MKSLTPTERKFLDAIIAYKLEHDGNSPSFQELADAVGYATTSVVHYHIHSLEAKGVILRSMAQRTIVIPGATWTPPADVQVDKLRPLVHLHDGNERCKTCGRPNIHAKGECRSCISYRNKTGKRRPAHLWRTEAAYGWCACGAGATILLMTTVGELPLCRRCARLELEEDC